MDRLNPSSSSNILSKSSTLSSSFSTSLFLVPNPDVHRCGVVDALFGFMDLGICLYLLPKLVCKGP